MLFCRRNAQLHGDKFSGDKTKPLVIILCLLRTSTRRYTLQMYTKDLLGCIWITITADKRHNSSKEQTIVFGHHCKSKKEQVIKGTLLHKWGNFWCLWHGHFLLTLFWVKILKTLVALNPRRRFLLIIQGIFLILLSSRSDKWHERQSNPLITEMNCEALSLFNLSDMYSWVSSAYVSRLPPKKHLLCTKRLWCLWWCFDKLIKTPFVHHLQRMDLARERSKFCVILIRNQPEVPDNFNQSLFSTAIQTRGLVICFFFWTELRNQLQSKCLRCCTYDSNPRHRLPTVVSASAPEPLLYVGLKTEMK